MSIFRRATRQQVPLKLGITGPSGSGKTTAALRLARGLVGPEGTIALVDTENGSASLYADLTPFDAANMNAPYQVAKFVAAIQDATEAGYQALIIDSGSAEWQELLAEKEALDSRGGNSFSNWASITKKHEVFLAALRNAPIHLILCLRAKQEHVQDRDANGRTTIKKVGLAAVQREGVEYELTTVWDIAMDHNAKASKDRTGLFDGRLEPISEFTGRELAGWLSEGGVPTPEAAPSPIQQAKNEALAKPAESIAEVAANVAEAVKSVPAQVSGQVEEFVQGVSPATISVTQFMEITEACGKHQVSVVDLEVYCVAKQRLAGATLRTLKAEFYEPLLSAITDGRKRTRLIKDITPNAA